MSAQMTGAGGDEDRRPISDPPVADRPLRATPITALMSLAIEVGLPFVIALIIGFLWRFAMVRRAAESPLASQAVVWMVENSLQRGAPGLPLDPSKLLRINNAPHDATRIRMRLGDTAYAGKISGSDSFYAAISDNRVRFRSRTTAQPSAPAARPEHSMRDDSTIFGFEGVAHAAGAVGWPAEQRQVLEQKVSPSAANVASTPMPEPRNAAAQMPLTSGVSSPLATAPDGTPNQKATIGTTQATEQKQGYRSLQTAEISNPTQGVLSYTTPEIVTAATMTALLQADPLGYSSVVFVPLGWGWDKNYSPSILAGADDVESRLHSVTLLRIGDIHGLTSWRSYLPAGSVKRRAFWFIATPLPFAGGNSLIEPTLVDPNSIPAHPAQLINPIYAAAHDTVLPFFAFVMIALLALLLGKRRDNYRTARVSMRGFIDGAAVVIGLAATSIELSYFWRWFPEFWIASASGLTCVGLSAGALIGGLVAALPHPRIQTTVLEAFKLRPVLYRDTPVDDIAADRLNFAPLVRALYRFLDNPGTAPPVVLSINGPWGSGKSSVMKMLASELSKTGRFRIVWFNAWQYHREEQILAAFLQSIARQLSEDWGATFALRLGWARWKESSLPRQIGVIATIAVVAAGVLHPVLRSSIADALGKALKGNYGSVVALFTGGASIGASAILLWGLQVLWPFRLQFTSLFAVKDQTRQLGFLAEFTREFKLYRQAVGDRKFLFVVDDLDRCQPDRVVDVLKGINLIITSADEAGRSFFVLGYDQSYILRAIEAHFKDLADKARGDHEHFGLQYLKKMVTLSVSVPQPERQEMQKLLERVEAENAPAPQLAQQVKAKPMQRLRGVIAEFDRSMRRVAMDRVILRQTALALLFMAMVIAIGLGNRAPRGASAPGVANTAADTLSPSLPGSVVTIELPAAVLPPALFDGPLLWTIPALLLIAATIALVIANRPEESDAAHRHEPRDSEAFLTSINKCGKLLPQNPRDAIRMVNLMRMEFLVQADTKAPLPGVPLDEWECVALTVLEKERPEVFQRISTRLGQSIKHLDLSAQENGKPANGTGIGEEARAALGRELAILSQAPPNDYDVAHLTDDAKLKRYIELNRFLIEREILSGSLF